MAETLPTWDEAVSAPAAAPTAQPQKELPSWEDAVSGDKSALSTTWNAFKPQMPHLLGTWTAESYKDDMQQHNQAMDDFFKNTAGGRIMSAMSTGAKEGFMGGGILPDTQDELKKAGILTDVANVQDGFAKSFHEAITAPAAATIAAGINLVPRALGAGYTAYQGGVLQLGSEIGRPDIGRDLALLPDALATPHMFGPEPHPYVQEVNKGVANGVVGVPESVWSGAKEPTPEQAAKMTEASAAIKPAEEAPEFNIHRQARQIAPEVFAEYDNLGNYTKTFRGWIDDFAEQRDKAAQESAPHTAEIAELQGKLESANSRKAKIYQAKIDELTAKNEEYIKEQTSKDTPEMAALRAEIQQADYRRRDLAPQVAQAYRDAEGFAPERPVAENTPTGEQAPLEEQAKPAEVDNTAQLEQRRAITEDFANKWAKAGQNKQEAETFGHYVALRYEELAKRLNNGKTAQELYNERSANVKAGKTKTSEVAPMELAQDAMPFDETRATELTDKARDLTGTTDNPKEAGYITKDGDMLDLSGRHYASGYKKENGRYVADKQDYLANNRAVDHREIANELMEDGGSEGMQKFINESRAIRVDFNSGYVNATFEPTPKQLKAIAKAANDAGLEYINVERSNPANGEIISQAYVHNITPAKIAKVFREDMFNKDLYQSEKPSFYSALGKSIDELPQGKGSPEQWQGIIKNLTQKGVKSEEIEWSGIQDWLKDQKGTVTKEQINDYLKANRIDVEEVVKDTGAAHEKRLDYDEGEEFSRLLKENDNLGFDTTLEAKQAILSHDDWTDRWDIQDNDLVALGNRYRRPINRDNVKYEKWQVPGGENYQELLMTLPRKDTVGNQYVVQETNVAYPNQPKDIRYVVYDTQGDRYIGANHPDRANAEASAKMLNTTQGETYKSSHFDEPNILSHIRFNERTDADGKRNMFIEEVQSDWHQAGRDKGYNTPEARAKRDEWEAKTEELKKAKEEAARKFQDAKEPIGDIESIDDIPAMTDKEKAAHMEYLKADEDLIQHYRERPSVSKIPDAPFKTSWPELAFKRALMWAVENDFDRVSWTTGDMQAARYDLSKQVEHIIATKEGDKFNIFARDKNGKNHNLGLKSADELPDIIGKDLSKKIASQESHTHTYEGSDLTVGGEGMKGFYDKILPNTVNKLVKKWGAKVEKKEIFNFKPGANLQHLLNNPEIRRTVEDYTGEKTKGGVEVHSLEITPAMRESIEKGGLPLFQEAKGKIRRATDEAKAMITRFQKADFSTMVHETAHEWLDEMIKDATNPEATAELKQDYEAVKKYLGIKDGQEITVRQHEKFARSFERYMMEGVAPTPQLARVFEQFKKWMMEIYKFINEKRYPINEDIRNVFDRFVTDKPERTVVADDHEPGKMFADIHEADAEHTPPEQALEVRDNIRKESDAIAKLHDPEVYDAINTARPTADDNGQPAADTGAPATGEAAPAAPREDVAAPQSTEVGEGGSEIGGEGDAGQPAQGSAAPTGGKQPGSSDEGKYPSSPNTLYGEPSSSFVDKAGNIRLDNLKTPEDVNEVLRTTANENEGFIAARRGVISDAQALDLADALGMDSKSLNMRKIGQAFNSEQILAARKLLIQSATELRDIMAKAATGGDADVLAYAEAKTRHQMIQEQVSGITAEAGRALRAFRALEGSKETKMLGEFLQTTTGKDLFQLKQEAQLGMELDSPQKISKFINDSKKPTFKDMVLEFWINALLSGPKTHVKNIIGNAVVAMYAIPETALAEAIGKVRNAVTGEEDIVQAGEARARMFGLVQGAKDGIIAAKYAFKNEEIIGASTHTVEQGKYQAIPSAKINVAGRELEVGGKQVRIPGRLLTAEDEFFKAVAYRQELNAQAYRTATKEGLKGDDFNSRVADIIQNPTEEMMQQASKNSDYQTFTNPLGATGRALQNFANSHFLAKIVVPFIRTPTNILKYAGERTPLGLASQEIRANLSGVNGGAARDTQIARMALGTTIGVSMMGLANQGLVTGGGPSDSKEKAMLRLTGWQPYSLKIGDMYYSYAFLDPFSTIMGVSADMTETVKAGVGEEEDYTKIASALFSSIAKNLMSKLSLRGASDLIQAVTDPDRYGEKYIQNLVGTLVPSVVAQTASTQDPVMRDARSAIDSIKARIPGMSESIMPVRDIWGEPIVRGESLGPNAVSPIYEARVNQDPVNQRLVALGVNPSRLDRKIRGVDLTPEQYDEYSKIAGRSAKMRLDAVVKMPGFVQMPNFAQINIISKIIEQARESARSLMLMKNPDIIKQANDNKMKELTGTKK